ncbi:hypothetical protein AVEN_67511-1 [Araneus ventricosus]|uniref:Uncharacterized protein n=1 Tax=Araneus ventricosus TaxID=182803 RepID=A0A4Y2S311_ARAVE|nr:hypothetical protein AVEN_67511-1 [Araneus ventricosus]
MDGSLLKMMAIAPESQSLHLFHTPNSLPANACNFPRASKLFRYSFMRKAVSLVVQRDNKHDNRRCSPQKRICWSASGSCSGMVCAHRPRERVVNVSQPV